MDNALQALFAVFWPTQIALNLVAGGVAAHSSAQSQGMIQDYKTGMLIGSTPRVLTFVQLAAVPVGAAAVAIMYPLLISRYGLGGEGLSAPTGVKIANMAVLLSRGFDALPRQALFATLIASILGIALSIMEGRADLRCRRWFPSEGALGFSLILPGEMNPVIAAGGIVGWLWMELGSASYKRYAVTVASGMIVGEALLSGLVLPILSLRVSK
jgi:uncharacterized oligopeptide transporter (OPT) family protein